MNLFNIKDFIILIKKVNYHFNVNKMLINYCEHIKYVTICLN